MSNSSGRWEFDRDGNVHYVPPDGSPEYSPPPPNTGRASPRQPSHSSKKKESEWHWIIIVLAFTIAWPIGLLLLLMEIAGKWPTKKTVHRVQTAAPPPPFQATTTEKKHSKKHTRKKSASKDDITSDGLGNIRLFRIIGGCMTGLFGFASLMTLIEELSYFYSLGYLMEELVPLLALTLIGVTLLGVAGGRSRKLKKFKKYLKLIGDHEEISLSTLAKTMGVKEKTVYQDVEEMLERNVLPEGYLDMSRGCLVLREGGVADEPPPAPEAPSETGELSQADLTLRKIRQLNDAIPNPELSRKIEQIEALTAKIFRLLEERPEKEGELRSFLNYYLPQTLKILENYAKLEAQGIEGENIAEAKQKIELMMDKVVDGYETQLDKLFADDVLDISADLKVMEAMLAKDGLTVENDFQL